MESGENFNKKNQLKPRLMDLNDIAECRKNTGAAPFVERKYV